MASHCQTGLPNFSKRSPNWSKRSPNWSKRAPNWSKMFCGGCQAKAMADDAQRDLDEALPALEAATASLKNLSRNDVVEVKSLSNPPAGVKMVMEVSSLSPLLYHDCSLLIGTACLHGQHQCSFQAGWRFPAPACSRTQALKIHELCFCHTMLPWLLQALAPSGHSKLVQCSTLALPCSAL